MVREFRLRRYYVRMDNQLTKRICLYHGRTGRPWALKEAFHRW